MSNPDSFIDEVTEEVRRDRLFLYFRRYGWIALLVVLLIVGGASWTEWRKARHEADSKAFGDAILTALDAQDPAARRAALDAIPAEGTRAGLRQLMLASDAAENRDATLAALAQVAADPALPEVYRDLAVLRRVIVAGASLPMSERRAALDGISAPGRPFRTLALEQSAWIDIEAGEAPRAIETLRKLSQDQEATFSLRRRAEQIIIALGGGTQAG